MSAFNSSPAVRGVGNAPRRQYITTSAFNADFYQYTTTRNPQTFVVTGALSAVTGATATNCPANRILRENAKRLYPDANPNINTLMVGVYDAISGLSGFIDPNAPIFAVYNTDKSYQTPNGVNPNGGATDQGPPIYTLGSVTAGTTITAGTGLTVTSGGVTVTAGGLNVITGMIRDSSSTALTTITGTGAQTAQNIDPNLGEIYTLTSSPSGAASITLNGTNITGTTGARVTLLITQTTANTLTITFGTGFLKTGTLAVTGAGNYYTISFISNGTNLYELSRTAAQT